MKKILLSLVLILVAVGAVTTATRAYFTSEVTQSNVTFSTGTLVMTDTSDDWMLPVSFVNLKPGDTIRKWVKLHNAGTLDIGQLTVGSANVNDPNGLLGQINVSVIGWVGQPFDSYFTPGWGTGGQPITWLSTSQDILSPAAIQYHNPGVPPSVIAVGGDDQIILDFTVPTAMGNSYQGKTATFDLVFHAEQVH